MSHIFDALQRSEAERTGTDVSGSVSVTELLQRAEIEEISKRLPGSAEEDGTESQPPEDNLRLLRGGLLSGAYAADAIASHVASEAPNQAEIFDQFPTVAVSTSPSRRLVSFADIDSPGAEAFRLLGVRLKDIRRERPIKRLLITSTVPGEGKSFAAANLACAISQGTPQRVLLVEGDLRHPSVSQVFGLGPTPGISEWLQGLTNLTSIIYRLDGPGIWILPAGSLPPSPLELMQSSKLPPLMDELGIWFDWIIIDSPPILPLADTSVWAHLADGIILVTRQGITEKRKLKRGLEELETNKLIGALLNSSANPIAKDYYSYSMSRASQQSETTAD